MRELDNIIPQVLKNCDISDAQHAGLFSVCGLALRLRDLYKWEKGLDPWLEKDSSAILDWIGEKEQVWEKIAENDYRKLSLFGATYEPFDTRRINAVLEPHGFFYGAGYARKLKPTFFLARIEDKRKIDGFTVYTLGRELARDLLTIPALLQDESILLRRESGTFLLWDQIFYIKKSGRSALNFALDACGIKSPDLKRLRRSLAAIYNIQREIYIYHEIGEIRDTVFDAGIWRQVINEFPHTPVELLTRAIKDLLADTNAYGTLQHIIKKRSAAMLGFYVAFLDGLAKALFPEMRSAFLEYTKNRNWQVIENAMSRGFNTAVHYAEEIIRIFLAGKQANDMQGAQIEIENRLLKRINSGPDSI
jgi:hypothetical protein